MPIVTLKLEKEKEKMTNVKNEVVELGVGSKAIANKELKKELQNILKAYAKVQEGTWQQAFALHTIESKKLYSDDYANRKEFCKDKNIDESLFTRCVGAVNVYNNFLAPNGYTYNQWAYNNVYVIGTLGEENIQMFIDYSKEKQAHIEQMTNRQLRAYVKAFKKMLEGAIDGDGEDGLKEEAKKEEKPKVAINGLNVELTIKGKKYIIPLKDLPQYEAKEETENKKGKKA